jgi:P4 family phage/plasmid primase-like protien
VTGAPPSPNPRLARVFLKMLDGARLKWEFRTFDDVVQEGGTKRKDPTLTGTFKGSRADLRDGSALWANMTRLNKLGAGVFVTINRTDGKGIKAENVSDVTAIFGDTDGAPLEPMLELQPHICVQSSPGKYHPYWRVSHCPLEQFKPTQQALIWKFGTDAAVNDLPRVMRLPGFFHNKHGPVLVTLDLEHMDQDREPYSLEEIVSGLGLSVGERLEPRLSPAALSSQREGNLTAEPPPLGTPENIAKVEAMLATIDPDVDRPEWMRVVWGLLATGWTCAEALAREWSMRGKKFNEADFSSVAASFKPDGGITFGTLDFIARKHGWTPPTVVTVAPQSTASPAQVEIVGARADRGDVQNAEHFARANRGRLMFIAETKQWLDFDPASGWLKAKEGEEVRAAKAVLTELARYAAEQWAKNPSDPKANKLLAHVEKSHDLRHLRAMIELAKSETCMTVSLNDFDADPLRLGLKNGVLDLPTGKLTPMSPDVLVSKRANVAFDPEADCPQWKKFLGQVQPDREVRAFLRRLCGYFLSGIVAEHIFPFISGEGGNGKSVFVEIIAWLLGDYAVKIETAMLMEHKRSPQAASPDLMKLRGARLGFCSETSEGQRLDAARVKEMSGGDSLTARPLYGHPVTFEPSHKLLMMGNYRPEVNDNSTGMWRRIILIPFGVEIPKDRQDPRLPERLKAEGAGILNWMLAGLRDWRKDGLQIPERIGRETDAYRDENDLLSQWMREDCELAAGCSERKQALYFGYQSWCERNGLHPLAQPRFTRRLRKQHRLELGSDERTIKGVRLKNSRRDI